MLVVVALLIGEVVARVVSPGRPRAVEHDSPPYTETSAALGWQPAASLRTHAQSTVGGQVVYDATYTFDAFRRRVVPGDPPAPYRRFLLFFGCSQTFGEGLEDDETLPYYVSRLEPGTHVYNYAFRGYGPQHMLARLETSNLRQEVEEPAGAAVFVLPAAVLSRLIGGSDTMGWVFDLPYYRMENGEPVRDGFFQTTRPFYSHFMRTLGRSRSMQLANVGWPPRNRPEDVAFACAVFAKAKRLLAAQLGPTPLVVMLHPGSGFLDLTPCLQLGIPVVDYHESFANEGRAELTIPIDGHTNARGNQMLAARLAADLARLLP